MEFTLQLGLGLAGLVLAAFAFALYRWRQRRRVRRLTGRVRDLLVAQHGAVPESLHIDCSEDASWPVLVSYVHPHTGSRHHVQFACWGPPPGIFLLAETVTPRMSPL